MGFRGLPPTTDRRFCMHEQRYSFRKWVHSINQTLKETQTPKKSKYFQKNILKRAHQHFKSFFWRMIVKLTTTWKIAKKETKSKYCFSIIQYCWTAKCKTDWDVSLHFLAYPCAEYTQVWSFISSSQVDKGLTVSHYLSYLWGLSKL